MIIFKSFSFGAFFSTLLILATASVVKSQNLSSDLEDYAAERRGIVTFETPEVFELANIILAITPAGYEPNSIFQDTPYYAAVQEHFAPYADHPVVAAVAYNVRRNDIQRYYNFRDNAVRHCFDGSDRIVRCTPHPAWYDLDPSAPGVWQKHIDLVEDFAKVTDFRRFYAKHAQTYRAQVEEYRREIDLTGMRRWLEANFDARWDSFRIVFSPLVGASHSAQRFETDIFREAIMLTAAPAIVESYLDDPALKRPELARMLFTELDHLYVNPASDRLQDAIDAAYSDMTLWRGAAAERYHNAYLVFNEYMTWAVFLLWTDDSYDDELHALTVEMVTDAMTGWRGFPRFAEFYAALRDIRADAVAGTRIEDLYPRILAWVQSGQE